MVLLDIIADKINMGCIHYMVILTLLASIIEHNEGIFGGRRRRRLIKVRVPPVRIPVPIPAVPPIRIPVPPVKIPPVSIPPIRVDPVIRNPVVRTVVRVGEEAGKAIEKGFNILKEGCCGLHPSYCSNREEFLRRQKEINLLSSQMNKDWAACMYIS